MRNLLNLLVGINAILWTGTLLAQTNLPSFQFTIKPASNAILIAETTNTLSVTISNLAQTNITVEPDPSGGTNSITNVVITALFTNVDVTATYPGGTNLTFLDNGKTPDKLAGDAVYSASFIAPSPVWYTNLTVLFTLLGDSLTYTNDSGELTPLTITNTLSVPYLIVARPPNDRLTNAIKIPPVGGLILATNNYASLEPGEPQHGKIATADASVWWMWSTPYATNVLIDTAGSSFNPVLAVYTGTQVNKLTEVAASGDDTVLHLKAHVNFNTTPGVTYRIAVAGQNTNGVGNIRLRIAPGAYPDTNGPLAKIDTPSDDSLFTTNLVDFTGVATDVAPNDTGVERVYLQVNNLKPVLASGSAAWTKTLDLPAGTNLVSAFAVDYAGNTGQVYAITVTYMNPTNDNFSSAIALAGSSGTILAINGRATTEPGEPLHAGNEGGHSIWYSWQAPANGLLFLTTANSDFDTLLGLYTGDSVTNLATIASNDDAFDNSKFSSLSQYVISNQVYYIAVDGYGGASGRVQLSYEFTQQSPPEFYTLTVNKSPGGSIHPGTGYYPTNSTVLLTASPDADYVFSRWEGGLTSTNNPLLLTLAGDLAITARFRFINYTETFESGSLTNLPWTIPSGTPWLVQTNSVSDGRWAARSGVIADRQESTLQLAITTLAGSGSFDFRVSSETGWDFLEFYVNGILQKKWSGDLNWRTFFFDVPAGSNTFLWRYAKDPHFSEGLDAAFVDNVFLPLGTLAPVLSINRMVEQSVQVQLQGKLNQPYILQASPNLVDWESVLTNRSPSGVIQYINPVTSQLPCRFYRAVTP